MLVLKLELKNAAQATRLQQENYKVPPQKRVNSCHVDKFLFRKKRFVFHQNDVISETPPARGRVFDTSLLQKMA